MTTQTPTPWKRHTNVNRGSPETGFTPVIPAKTKLACRRADSRVKKITIRGTGQIPAAPFPPICRTHTSRRYGAPSNGTTLQCTRKSPISRQSPSLITSLSYLGECLNSLWARCDQGIITITENCMPPIECVTKHQEAQF